MNKQLFRKSGITGILILLSGLSACENDNNELRKLETTCDSISNLLSQQRTVSDSLRKITGKETGDEDDHIFYGTEFSEIENPEELITEKLKEKPELIPLDPILGGTMDFSQIEILSEDWLIAQYSDGHIQGRSIYKYDRKPDGSMDFKILLSQHQ